jgi:site-specific recombinase XerD
MNDTKHQQQSALPTPIAKGLLTRKEFQQLADVPPELEWFANIDNARTRRAYQIDLKDFMSFVGITHPSDFRMVTRAHLIAWRKDLEQRQLGGATIRRKLAALSSLFEYLCERNAVESNLVKGVKRPPVDSYEGKTPALGDHQARALLNAPDSETLKGKRDRAILSTQLYHGLRREELCLLKVRDLTARRGVQHLRVHGKGGKTRYLPLHPGTAGLITDYLETLGAEQEGSAPLFRPVKNNMHKRTDTAMTADGVYKLVQVYAAKIGLTGIERLGVHALRATAATNALDHQADIAKVQRTCQYLNHPPQ